MIGCRSILAAAWVLVLWPSPLWAQDRILLQQPGGSRFPLTGFVEEYTGREITIRLKPDDPVRRYPRSEIVEVTTDYTSHHDRARKLLAAGKAADAKKEYSAAFDDENRNWVRREILAGQIKCAFWTGDYQSAAIHFFPIVDADPETFHFNLIPLKWTEGPSPANIVNDARQWILPTTSPSSRLIGASWLLAESDPSFDVEQILRRLARESDAKVQRLAQMQLWRLKLKSTELLAPEEIQHWERFVEGLPVELRGGAYFLIGEAWKARREYERAARAYLWLPLVYDSDRYLCSQACLEAANSMALLGDTQQALNLYSEVVFRYGDTPWGPTAESAWKKIRQANAAK